MTGRGQPPRTLDPSTAVLVGTAWVNVPVFALLFGPAFLAFRAGWPDLRILFVVLASFIVAWAYWSVSVPRWRLWAYERVPSTGQLQDKALAAGLVWAHGSFFASTEIKSAAHRRKEQEFEQRKP